MRKSLFLLSAACVLLFACSAPATTQIEDGQVLYKGTVAAVEAERMTMSELTPVEADDLPSFDEVILLTQPSEEIEVGDTVEVVLKENTPTTRSLPPQIPGDAIFSVEIVDK